MSSTTAPVSNVQTDDITHMLEAARQGEVAAADRLMAAVYDELQHMAAARLASEHDTGRLEPTELVHEAWLRLGRRPAGAVE